MNLTRIKQEWFSNIRSDMLAGLVVALALIPEAIAFSIIAGVDPKVGLYASFCIAVVIAFTGGRPGMISAATAAMALLMVTLVKEHGLEYLLAATLLTGVLQIIAGYLQVGRYMRFISNSVMTGFVNALAIMIFLAQLPELTDVTWHVYVLTALGLGIIYLFPYLTRSIPSPLVTIVVLTLLAWLLNLDIRTVSDMGELPNTLPVFLWPEVPLNLETLWIILPYALALTVVGLLESMMTQNIVDDLTDTRTDKNRECKGQGISNIVAGSFGGMAGCAMIGQSVINIKSGGRGRLSTLMAGVYLLVMVVFLSPILAVIPMAALVAVMIMVSIGTFSWTSIKNMKDHPMSTNIVMITTVAVTVFTHNLAIGVLSGVLLAALFFANKVSQFMFVGADTDTSPDEHTLHRTYRVYGQVFFASTEKFMQAFNFREDLDKVTIDLSRAHFWDISSVAALDRVVINFRREGAEVEIIGMNEATSTIVDRHAVHDKPDAADRLMGH
ncbi:MULTISPECIES: SulP family inorganic anion transporter [unclassified Ectothiorhodospira]|uniref:SulP family inorganic anion transporter n=1 Tax=unclassified Ectothiorhodospira TaxID=2684909 RepID=UPI001EE7D48A|nr:MULTISPECIES: SulP family inorganic anion transporter [unclassified Ectothiorhodospira]MCG5514534.1 SulP family inorganic anion transporter [Ectothiorhodospira sp. 9100]MCG5518662.1 SulP family inorganic anion transporter [Ectothiorhodospira sp. 9905]